MNADDLAPLLAAGRQPDVGFHVGQIVAWNNQTGENTIRILGSDISNVPALNLTEMLTLALGMHVGILRFKNTYFILGRVTIPGSDTFFSGAMPDIATPFYHMNSDSALQTSAVGSYFSKLIAGYVVNHPKAEFNIQVSVSGAGATGAFRVQWYSAQPPNTANPTGGTLMGSATGIPGNTGTFRDFTYTWPAGMRGQLVYISVEPNLTAGTGGVDWVHALVRYFIGKGV